MADGAVNFLLDKLTNTLLQKASLLGKARDEVEEIKLELESMRSFIRDAERRMEMSESIETWVRQVREVAYEVEDIIDEFLHAHMISHKNGLKNGFKGLVKGVMKCPNSTALRHRIASRLQYIKGKVLEVSERSKRYGFESVQESNTRGGNGGGWDKYYGESSYVVDENEIVGMEASTEELVGLVMDDEPKRRIISIVGMGGLGKTTLVSRVYNDQAIIKRCFDCWLWISVSQTNGIRELLRSMVTELKVPMQETGVELGSMSYRQLVGMLIDYLHHKRYFIVLDDIWSIDLWSIIRSAFPSNRNGSRTVLTTRNENVAASVGIGSHVHRLQPLEEKDAWTLFCHKVFWNNNSTYACPHGLPLAILAIGGLLCARKKTVMEWKKVYDSLSWQLNNNPMLEQVKGILLLSFNDLPFYLKHCFLYCSVFRDGQAIKRKSLVQLWVAEGFVKERKGMTMEETAEEYLSDIVLRSMIQVTGTNDAGRIKVCRVHDVMRELAVTTSAKENFSVDYDANQVHQPKVDGRIHRLSVYSTSETVRLSSTLSHQLRSFFVFPAHMASSSFSLDTVVPKFRLLRVLCLEGVPIDTIPSMIVELFNLRNTKISINKLNNLQTLDLKNTSMEKLPSGISKLPNLRHLSMRRRNKNDVFLTGLPAPSGLWNLRGLHTLARVEADAELIQQISNLTGLKRLEITNLSAGDGPNLCSSLQRMTGLTHLRLMSIKADEELNLDSLQLPPLFLQKLTLVGSIKQTPPWVSALPNLTHLHFVSSCLTTNILPSLHSISSLVVLELKNAFAGKSLQFKAGQFRRLTKLKLQELPYLDSIILEKGSLPNMREMALIRCQQLKLLPSGIQNLTSLQKLHLENMPGELVQAVQRHVSEIQEVDVFHISCSSTN